MAMRVRLDCPLCGATVVDGDEPESGECPECNATFVGGAERPDGAAEEALRSLGFEPENVARLTTRLFDDDAPRGVAITSDRREGFYRWWVFVADEDAARAALAEFARPPAQEG